MCTPFKAMGAMTIFLMGTHTESEIHTHEQGEIMYMLIKVNQRKYVWRQDA
jgi:hypothetical protein